MEMFFCKEKLQNMKFSFCKKKLLSFMIFGQINDKVK